MTNNFQKSRYSFLWNTLNNGEQNDFVKLLILLTIATNSAENIEDFLNDRLFYPSLVRLVEKLRKKLLSIHYHDKTLYSSENKELKKLSEELLNENLSPEYRLSIAVKKFLELVLSEFVHGGYREQILFGENSVEILYKELVQPTIEQLQHLQQEKKKKETISSSIFDELRLRLSALSMISLVGGYVDTLKFLNDYFIVDVGLDFPSSTNRDRRKKTQSRRKLLPVFSIFHKGDSKKTDNKEANNTFTVSELIKSTLEFLYKEFSIETEIDITKLDVLLKPETILNKLYGTCPNTSLTLIGGKNRENNADTTVDSVNGLFLFVERNNLFETKVFSLSAGDSYNTRIRISLKGLVEEFLRYLLEESEIRELFPVLLVSEDKDTNTNSYRDRIESKKLSSSKVLERFYMLIERAKRTTNELFFSTTTGIINPNASIENINDNSDNREEISTTTVSADEKNYSNLTYTILVSLFPALVIDFLIRRILSLSKEEREQKDIDKVFRFYLEQGNSKNENKDKRDLKDNRDSIVSSGNVPFFAKLNVVYLFGEYLTKKVFPALGIHASNFVVSQMRQQREGNNEKNYYSFNLEFVIKSPEVLALRRKVEFCLNPNPFSPITSSLVDIEVSELKNVSFVSSSLNSSTLVEIKVLLPNNSVKTLDGINIFTLKLPFSPESSYSLLHLQQTVSVFEVLFSTPVFLLFTSQ